MAGNQNNWDTNYTDYPKFLTQLKKALAVYKFGLSIILSMSYWYLQHFDLVFINLSVD